MLLFLFQFSESRGQVYEDENGNIWWNPQNGNPAQLLADSDSVCGIFPFTTGLDDVFRNACGIHDHFYTNRAQYENWGFDRKWMDDMFYGHMLQTAGNDPMLKARAREYYLFARSVGWIFYYRHPAGTKNYTVQYKPSLQAYNEPDTAIVDPDLVARFAYHVREIETIKYLQLERLKKARSLNLCPTQNQ